MANKFEIEQLNQEKLIKTNKLSMINNPIMFGPNSIPTTDGLLSNEIFGITKEDRAETFAYLDLNEYFIQPYLYRVWLKVDRNIRAVVYETKNFHIDSNGMMVEDENGETGIEFLRKNIDKINFKNTKRDSLLKVLMDNKNILFTNKFIIIPPYYRDVDTNGGSHVSVGEINKLYVGMMNNIRALKESKDYGLSMRGDVKGRIQDDMLKIYNWFTIGESVSGGEHTGAGIFKKFGVMRRSVMSKTTDYSARLVLSAPNINCNSKKDFIVDLNYSAIPLSASCVIFYPYMLYALKAFFNNEFGGKVHYNRIDASGKVEQIELKDPQIEFSDERFDREIDRFVHGYSNRLTPIEIPNVENKKTYFRFKGYSITEEEYARGVRENGKMIERDLTWMDILFMCAVEVSEDKMVLITRYPIDSYFNQFPSGVHVTSTINTEPMVINGKFYKWYPKITQADIGKDTSNMFIDTCSIANPYCVLMGADYDGDQVTVKAAYTIEANEELRNHMNSNAQFITLGGTNGRTAGNEAIQAMYNLTLVLPDTKDKLTNPVF